MRYATHLSVIAFGHFWQGKERGSIFLRNKIALVDCLRVDIQTAVVVGVIPLIQERWPERRSFLKVLEAEPAGAIILLFLGSVVVIQLLDGRLAESKLLIGLETPNG